MSSERKAPRLYQWSIIMLGVFAADLLLLVFVCGPVWLFGKGDVLGPFGPGFAIGSYISFFTGPLAAGLVASLIWRSLRPGIGKTVWLSLLATAIGLTAAAIILGEGAVCLVVSAPLLWSGIFAGAAVGRVWFRRDSSTLRLSIIPLIAVLALGERFTHTDRVSEVVDEITINATPEQIWPHLLAFSDIKEPPSYWIFRMGLPYPVATTNGGNFVGADRSCIFSDGIVIKERIAEFEPGKRLTFDITGQPDHPEAYGHITLQRGRFDLRPNGDGTTTLIGTSWYTLHVRPWRYFDWWATDMTRAVHLRVMRHIQRVAEGGDEPKG